MTTYQHQHRLSMEDAARRVRLGFLARVMAEQGADAVAVGHTHDDQAETVLLHLIRGSGLTGLRGMQTLSTLRIAGATVVLVRPLLGATRQETAEFCRALGVEPRLDETNLSHEVTRNRVRLELLPLMESINPGVKDALTRLSRTVALDLALIEREVDRAAQTVVSRAAQTVWIDRKAFDRLDSSVKRHLLRRAVLLVKPEVADLTETHVQAMVRLMAGPTGKSLDLPAGLRFLVSYAEASIRPRDQASCALPALDGQTPLRVPGETWVGGWRVRATVATPPGAEPGASFNLAPATPDRWVEYFDADSMSGRLTVRTRRAGDRIQALGMAGTKKLQDFMVDSRIPREWRDSVPLVVSERGIAWVVGRRMAEWARVREDTVRTLRIEFAAAGEPETRPGLSAEAT